jgi:hypothetical protein
MRVLCVVQVINDIRNRTGARVNLFDEEKNCGDRMLQVRHIYAAVLDAVVNSFQTPSFLSLAAPLMHMVCCPGKCCSCRRRKDFTSVLISAFW